MGDRRIHLILYFFEGHRVKDNDIQLIKRLQDFTSVLPVVCKGDSFTPPEMLQHKLAINDTTKERQVEFFDCHQAVRN